MLPALRYLIRSASTGTRSTLSSTFRKMSTVTIAVLDDSELKDGQLKEVPFKDGKVLLSRLGDKVHATSAFCTHYALPLSKGVLTADGRIVCAFHGACFNVFTGDIEDAPAPSALHTFKTSISDGKIHVTANPEKTLKDNLSRPSKLSTSGVDSPNKGVLIIGGGSGGYHAVESLREHGYKAPITILTKEPHTPIDRTKLSKALITDPSKVELKSAADLRIRYGTTIRTGVEVTSIDFESKNVTIDGGKEQIAYDKLILATGGTPRRLPVEGAELENVFTFRGIDDAKKVDAAAQEGKRLVVIGSSFIGMEVTAAVAKRKLQSIDVIGTDEVPFEAVLGKEIGQAFKKYHESQGVRFHMKSKVEKIVPDSENPDRASSVVFNGETIQADFIVMGVGVVPATKYLEGSGIELEKDKGVRVDEYMRVPGKSGVYAIGDIAHYPQHGTGELRRVEHWNVAGNQGRAVGKTISGDPQPFVKVPIFWSSQGQQIRYCGIGKGFDDVIIKGDIGEMKFIAYYIKDDKVVAVASMQKDPAVSKASELMRLGLMPSPEELRAGKDLMEVDLFKV